MMKWKCATTKYVSVVAWSNGIAANMIPERPPSTKNVMKPPMKRSGVLKSGLPSITVDVQAKTWIVEGMTTIMLAAAKKTSVSVGSPVAKKWNERRRWSSRKTQSIVSGGSAKMSESETARIAYTNRGMRFRDMPGAR